jgi:hypothetical protein
MSMKERMRTERTTKNYARSNQAQIKIFVCYWNLIHTIYINIINHLNHYINYSEVNIIIRIWLIYDKTHRINILDSTVFINTKMQNYLKFSCYQTHVKSTPDANIEMDRYRINYILQDHAAFWEIYYFALNSSEIQ